MISKTNTDVIKCSIFFFSQALFLETRVDRCDHRAVYSSDAKRALLKISKWRRIADVFSDIFYNAGFALEIRIIWPTTFRA